MLLLLLAAGGVAAAAAARSTPPMSDVVGADLLAGAANSCDMPMAFHMVESRSFSPGWLTARGKHGETAIMAATSAGCSELVALIALHPGFDDKTVKKARLRRELAEYAILKNNGHDPAVKWCFDVLDNVLLGKVSQQELEWDPTLAASGDRWYLPAPGEWMRPATLAELGIQKPMRPRWNLTGISFDAGEKNMMLNRDGGKARIDNFDKLWHLLVIRIQTPIGSERHEAAIRQIRSIGWSTFFWGGQAALWVAALFIAECTSQDLDIPADDDPVHAHLVAEGVPVEVQYRAMAQTLTEIWNKTGTHLWRKRKSTLGEGSSP